MSAVGPNGKAGRSASARVRIHAAVLAMLCLAAYNANLRFFGAYDTLPASLIPFEVVAHGSLHLDRLVDGIPAPLRYGMTTSSGAWTSAYPIVTPLLAVPLYAPLRLAYTADQIEALARSSEARQMMEKLSASTLAALSVVLLFVFAARTAGLCTAWLIAIAFAFGTPTWTIASQALWQHGPAQMLLAAGLVASLGLAGHPSAARLLVLGSLAGLITANRPQDVVHSAALGALVLASAGRRTWIFVAPAALIAGILFFYNSATFGTPIGGYPGMVERRAAHVHFGLPSIEAGAGLLVSNRGLLFFSPFLLLALRRPRVASPVRLLRPIALTAVLASVGFYSCFSTWHGGYCYGPRYLLDGVPWLIVLLPAAFESLGGWGRALFVSAVAAGVGIQAIGAFCFPGLDSGNPSLGVWSVARSSVVLAARAGIQSPHFLVHRLFPQAVTASVLPDSARAVDLDCRERAAGDWLALDTRRIDVALTHRGDRPWSSLGTVHGRGAVRLRASWTPEPTGPAHAGTDVWLSSRVRPGESVRRSITVLAPRDPGSYTLTIEPAQFDGTRWLPFSESGATPCRLPVRVVAGG